MIVPHDRMDHYEPGDSDEMSRKLVKTLLFGRMER